MPGHQELFCDNPACYLHVPLNRGHNWAKLPDGRVYGRSLFNGRNLCDACQINPDNPVQYEILPADQ